VQTCALPISHKCSLWPCANRTSAITATRLAHPPNKESFEALLGGSVYAQENVHNAASLLFYFLVVHDTTGAQQVADQFRLAQAAQKHGHHVRIAIAQVSFADFVAKDPGDFDPASTRSQFVELTSDI